jgi:type I restriction enzyme S subunit
MVEKKAKDGYTKTDVGIIPNDWKVIELGDYVTIRSGESPSKFKFFNKGIPFFKVEQLNNCVKYQIKSPTNISVLNPIPKGSIIFPKRGASILLNKVRILNQDSFMDTNLMTVTTNEKVYNEFLYYMLSYLELWKIADTTSVPQINNKHIKPYKIALPSMMEQNLIASSLSEIDNLLQSLEKLIDKKKKIKQGTMQQLLTGKKRLPGFSGEWKSINLWEVGSCIRGVSYKPEADLEYYDKDNTVRLLRSNNIKDNILIYDEVQFVKDNKVKEHQTLIDEDIVICMANGSKELVGKAAIFKQKDVYSYTIGAFMGIYRVNSKNIDKNYVSLYFQSDNYRKHIGILLSGSSINNLKPYDIESIAISIPTYEEQKAIARIICDMDLEIEALVQKLKKFKKIKQGMMQELLTGRIRLI